MASNNGASGSHGHSKSSRFSTMKLFKFNGKEKPPPPPPKDPYYLSNRSMTSLSPDSVSLPPQSPLSPHSLSQYPHRPAPSQSTMSLVSSTASQLSVPPTNQDTPKRKKSLNFLKFRKRSKSREPDVPLPPGEDENISWPSNFQHNIHVDDGLLGLPPSWSKSLADIGYSEEEIANLNVKRAVNSRAVQQLYSAVRPESPAPAHHPTATHSQSSHNDRSVSPAPTHKSTSSPILTHPLPRSTSLVRKYSNASIRGRPPPPSSTSVPVPTLVTSPSSTSLHSVKTTSTSTCSGPPRSNTAPSLHNVNSSIVTTPSDADLSYQTVSPDFSVVTSSFHGVGSTTPTKRLHLANPITPPPAYSVPNIPTIISMHKEAKSGSAPGTTISAVSGSIMAPPIAPTLSLPVPPSIHVSQPSVEPVTSSQGNESTLFESQSTPQLQRQQNGNLSRPPRLSLHASNESDDWSKLVLSASLLDADGQVKNSKPLSTSQKAQTRTPPPPTRPIPPIVVPDADNEELTNSAHAPPSGWAEPATTARYPPSSAASAAPSSSSPSWQEFKRELGDYVERDDFKEVPYSAAYTESFSPTIPDCISRSTQRDTLRAAPNGALLTPPQERYMQQDGTHADDDDDLLSARRSNRDSSRSSSSTLSTSTVTGYTYSTPPIIRNASIVRRAGAYVTKVPLPPATQSKEPAPPSSPLLRSEFQVQALSEASAENPPLSPVAAGFQNKNSDSASSRRSVPPPSPMNSQFGSDESTGSTSTTSSSSQSQDHSTPTDSGSGSGLACYINTPSPSKTTFPAQVHSQDAVLSPRDTFGNSSKIPRFTKVVSEKENVSVDESFVDLGRDDDEYDEPVLEDEENEEEGEEGTWDTLKGNTAIAAANDFDAARSLTRPAIIVSGDEALPTVTSPTKPIANALTFSLPATPLTPIQRYPGWLSGVVKPLSPFIDEAIEPREHYVDLQEIAEGESGSIFAAHLEPSGAKKLRLPAEVRARDAAEMKKGEPVLVAIKIIAIAPPSPEQTKPPEAQKLVDLERELALMKGLWHENILGLDALYVDLTEDTLWVRMELMERSLADIVGLVVDGLMLQDRMIARFARDVLHALEFLQKHRIAHRDVRSDNLLLNSHGVLKLTDFSNAVALPKESSLRSDPAGVIFWQAPEMRYPNYDALKVDVWSLGATIWEMAETEPPFSDTRQVQSRWPSLTRPEMWSPAFHSFLRACSDSAAIRKSPTELVKDPFVSNACGRGVIVQLLSQCMNIERMIQGGNDS